MLEEIEDIEKRKEELKERIESLKLRIELMERRSGRPRVDKGLAINKKNLARYNSEYIRLISRKYIEENIEKEDEV
ncbi:MAG: hypothetical protein ACLUFU_00230 [Bacilli bacterium]